MADLSYLESLTDVYMKKANLSGTWTNYLKAHGLANACLANATGEDVDKRRKLVYDIETDWYKGAHPLSQIEHQELTRHHKELLVQFRLDTEKSFNELDELAESLDMDDVFSRSNTDRLNTFSGEVFQRSEMCSEKYIGVLENIVKSSIQVLRNLGKEPPCEFAVIALGSIAKGVATPYSDIEYAILVESDYEIEYFMMLAVDTYFRIGNLCETPIKSLGIKELDDADKPLLVINPTVGLRLDGSDQPGNIPTGTEEGQRLIQTVEEFVSMYKNAAISSSTEALWDLSHLLSASSLVFSNEREKYKLHEGFKIAISQFEKSEAQHDENISKKRLRVFLSDIERYRFLSAFQTFDGPDDVQLKLNVNLHIYRYATLLAHNLKISFALEPQYLWDILSTLLDMNVLSNETHQLMRNALAMSVYIRTVAYLGLKTQVQFVSVGSKTFEDGGESKVPSNLFVILGCILVPLQRSIATNIDDKLYASNLKCSITGVLKDILGSIDVTKQNRLLKAELYFLIGKYTLSLDELSLEVGKRMEVVRPGQFLDIVRKTHSLTRSDPNEKRYMQLCSYVFYRTGHYRMAMEYLTTLTLYSPSRVELATWKIAIAHCLERLGNHRPTEPLLKQVIQLLKDSLDLGKTSVLSDYVINELTNKEAVSSFKLSVFKIVAELYKVFGNVKIASQEFTDAADHHSLSSLIYSLIETHTSSNAYRYESVCSSTPKYNPGVHEIQKALTIMGKEYSITIDVENLSDQLGEKLSTGSSDVGDQEEKMGRKHYHMGNYQLALQSFITALGLREAVNKSKEHNTALANCYSDIGNTYNQLGDYQSALQYHTKSLELRKTLHGANTNHVDIACNYNNIGSTYSGLGEYVSALQHYTKSLEMRKAVYGTKANHPDIARNYSDIGSAYSDLGEYKSALEYYIKSLGMSKAVYGAEANHPDVASSYNNIGSAYSNLGEYTSALECYTKSLEMRKAVYGTKANHPDIARNYSNIGSAYSDLGEYKSALEYYTKSLGMRKALYGAEANHPKVAASYNNIGSAYSNLGEYTSALQYYIKSLEMRKVVYGAEANHPDVATSYNNIGSVYSNLGEYTSALECYIKSLEMRKAVYGVEANHPDVASSYNNIGSAYSALGEYTSALEYYTKSLAMKKALYGDEANHPDIAASYNNIGSAYSYLGEYTSALEYYTKSLGMRKVVYGAETIHPDVAASYNNIGSAYSALGEYTAALEYYTKSLAMMKALYGDETNHPDKAASYNNIGITYSNLGEYTSALEYYTKSLQMMKVIYGSEANHPRIATSYTDIGNAYNAVGQYTSALDYHTKSLKIMKAVYGTDSNHPDIAASYNSIGNDYSNMGDYTSALEYFVKSLQMVKQVFGVKSVQAVMSRNNVARTYSNLGKFTKAKHFFTK